MCLLDGGCHSLLLILCLMSFASFGDVGSPLLLLSGFFTFLLFRNNTLACLVKHYPQRAQAGSKFQLPATSGVRSVANMQPVRFQLLQLWRIASSFAVV